MDKHDKQHKKDANLDPITKAPGAHPVGTGIGAAAGGAAAGAAAGSVLGPAGTLAGAAAGAVAGGLAGKAVAEKIDPTVEEAYWREHYTHEPYYEAGLTYDDYAPAYRTGYEARARVPGVRTFEEVERDLERDYQARKDRKKLDWQKARPAARAAWDRPFNH
jgi:hypothetical protein